MKSIDDAELLVRAVNAKVVLRALIFVVSLVAAKLKGSPVEDIAAETKNCGNQHNAGVDVNLVQVSDTPDGFVAKPKQQDPDDENATASAHDVGAVVPVSVVHVSLLGGEVNRKERNDEASDVGELVGSVSKNSERARQDTTDEFN